MSKAARWTIDRWTVDYGDGREPCTVPHVWRQDLDIRSEGPVVYRVKLQLPPQPAHLVFHGVSYEAIVRVDGAEVARHRGIWDAFKVPLGHRAGERIDLEVEVRKNGGETFPVRETLAGFLPFVHHTFGGLFREVELVLDGTTTPVFDAPAAPSPVRVEGRKLFVDDKPFFPRGLLHWGWFPEVGSPHPSMETIRKELADIKARGYNVVKFCLWFPPHRYLQAMRAEGLEAWLELPLWEPVGLDRLDDPRIAEIERIVRQYRHHENVIAWSIGCELGGSVPATVRKHLVELVRNLTHCPLVGDSSGGAEMYGGDLREFGDYEDFHPYCDLSIYPQVLDSMLPHGRTPRPILFGEFNDFDVHRDLAKIHHEMPYWASSMVELNDKGVRWQYDLPNLISDHPFAHDREPEAHRALMESSRQLAIFIRKSVHEHVRARSAISGVVTTCWRDTPISTAGIFDDWNVPRYSPAEMLPWNGPDVLYALPMRNPLWRVGGNRPGGVDVWNRVAGPQVWRIGFASEAGTRAGLVWQVVDSRGAIVARGAEPVCEVPALESAEVGTVFWADAAPGSYTLQVEFGSARNEWPVWIVPPYSEEQLTGWWVWDREGALGKERQDAGPRQIVVGSDEESLALAAQATEASLVFLDRIGTIGRPFYREAAYRFVPEGFWAGVPFVDHWARLLPVAPDRVIDPEALPLSLREAIVGPLEARLLRVDTRTFEEHAVLAQARLANGGTMLLTTLRPWGGIGYQPPSFATNPAGQALLISLLGTLQS